jgi:hypothetical protein
VFPFQEIKNIIYVFFFFPFHCLISWCATCKIVWGILLQ